MKTTYEMSLVFCSLMVNSSPEHSGLLLLMELYDHCDFLFDSHFDHHFLISFLCVSKNDVCGGNGGDSATVTVQRINRWCHRVMGWRPIEKMARSMKDTPTKKNGQIQSTILY